MCEDVVWIQLTQNMVQKPLGSIKAENVLIISATTDISRKTLHHDIIKKDTGITCHYVAPKGEKEAQPNSAGWSPNI